MGARWRTWQAKSLRVMCLLVGVVLFAGCAPRAFDLTGRVALLGSFEGRYREVGYNALYAARLAVEDAAVPGIELLLIDDGGTVQSATERALALAQDPLVKAVLLTGYAATAPETQVALGDLPALIIGNWSASLETDTMFMLASRDLAAALTTPPGVGVLDAAAITGDVTGGEVFALEQIPLLSDHLDTFTIVSNANLPDAAFAERYQNSGLFVPEPGLLATLTYDATRIALEAASQENRAAAGDIIRQITYTGLNGTIRFEDHFWAGAPLHFYRYDANGQLTPVEGIVK